MPPLSDLQGDFASAVMDAAAPVPEPVTSHTGLRPQKRFNVYRNNIYASLISVLEGRFPVVARLVGPQLFTAIARDFTEKRPPRSPILMEYGEHFPEFLAHCDPVRDLLYLPDVARIEWAWNIAYYAADATSVNPEDLKDIAPERIPHLMVTLHPSLSVVRSRYPVVTIWTANCEEEEPEPIDAGAGGEDAMILRPDTTVEVRRLPEGGAVFISALAKGRTLGRAADAAFEAADTFDLQANLAGLFSSGAIVAVQGGALDTSASDV